MYLLSWNTRKIRLTIHYPVIAGCFLWLLISPHTVAATPTATQLNQARIAGLAWLLTHQGGDGSWKSANGATLQATTAALAALTNAGIKQGYSYTAAIAYTQNTPAPSVDALARQIMALSSAGLNTTPYITQLNQWQNAKTN
ncbi:MAG: hypothetical protein HY080_02865 [Gammaproteobacteria bacterium]|nr:hypothetical protein [Gammaproteobacteria bacterium]